MTDALEALGESNYYMVEMNLRALLAASPKAEPVSEDKRDAERWRAFLGSARIRILGAAGIREPEPNNYAHFGMEIWTTYGRDYSADLLKKMDDGNEYGRTVLTKYADIAIAAATQSPTKEST